MPFNSRVLWLQILLTAGHPLSLQESDAVTLLQGPRGSFKSPLWEHGVGAILRLTSCPLARYFCSLPGSLPGQSPFKMFWVFDFQQHQRFLRRTGNLVSSNLQIYLESDPSHPHWCCDFGPRHCRLLPEFLQWPPLGAGIYPYPSGSIFSAAVRVALLKYKSESDPSLF